MLGTLPKIVREGCSLVINLGDVDGKVIGVEVEVVVGRWRL